MVIFSSRVKCSRSDTWSHKFQWRMSLQPSARRWAQAWKCREVPDYKNWMTHDGTTLLEDEDSQVWVPSEDLHKWKPVPEEVRRELGIGEFEATPKILEEPDDGEHQ